MSGRIVVLMSGGRKRTYPVPLGAELHDHYTIDGERWVVVAVLTTDDVSVVDVPQPH